MAICMAMCRRDLADVMLAVHDRGDFAFAFDCRSGAEIVSLVPDELEILLHPSDAMTGIAAQFGFHQQPCDQIGITRRHAAGIQ